MNKNNQHNKIILFICPGTPTYIFYPVRINTVLIYIFFLKKIYLLLVLITIIIIIPFYLKINQALQRRKIHRAVSHGSYESSGTAGKRYIHMYSVLSRKNQQNGCSDLSFSIFRVSDTVIG